jgi:acetyl esterase
MALTAKAAEYLELFNAQPWPPLDSATAPAYRRVVDALITPLEADPALAISDHNVRVSDRSIPIRIYRPDAAAIPTIVFYHGGGFVACGLDSHEGLCRALAKAAKAAVISVSYRLAPEHKFPAAVDDALAALTHIARHGEELGIDSARLAVAGDSAGGNLATVSAMRARDAGGPALAHQLLIYPVLDLSFSTPSYKELGEGYFLTQELMEWYRSQYIRSVEDIVHPWTSPLVAQDLCGLPPATIVTAEYDPLRDEGERYAVALGAAGVPVHLERVPGVFHGFVSLLGALPEADAVIALAGARLQDAFAGTSQG